MRNEETVEALKKVINEFENRQTEAFELYRSYSRIKTRMKGKAEKIKEQENEFLKNQSICAAIQEIVGGELYESLIDRA